jgi:thioredoxin 1
MELTITNENYDSLKNQDKLMVIDFWATWCGPCKTVGPMISEMSEKFGDKVNIGKCDVEENDDLTSEFGIRNVPTIVFIKKGKVVDKIVGTVNKAKLEATIESLI